MKIDFAIRALNKIKEIEERYYKLKDLGVDLIDFETGINIIEEAVTIMFSKDKKEFKLVLDNVQWWLYEDVDKIVYYKNGKTKDLNSIENFINYLDSEYNTKEKKK